MGEYIKELRGKVGHIPLILTACGVLIENENEEILLQERSDTLNFGIPGGNMELGESLKQTALREVKEETGLDLEKLDLFGIFSGENCHMIYPNGDECYYNVVVFYSKIKDVTTLKYDSESKSLTFFKRNELPRNIKESDKIWINKWKDGDFSITVA